jgi:hypothetical protein
MPSDPAPNRGDSKSEDESTTLKTKDAAATSVSLKQKGSEDSSKDGKEEPPKAASETDADTTVATKTSLSSKPKGADDSSSKAETEEAPEPANDADDAVTAKTALLPKEKGSEDASSDEKKAVPAVPIDRVVAAANHLMSKRKESEDSSKAESESAPEPPANAVIATKTSVLEDSSKDEKEGSSKDERDSSKDEKEDSSEDEEEAEPEATADDTGAARTSEDSLKAKGGLTPRATANAGVNAKASVSSKRKGSMDSSNSEGEASPEPTADITTATTARTSSSKKRKRKTSHSARGHSVTNKEALPPPPLKLNHVLFAAPTSETKKKRSRKSPLTGMSSDPENDDGVEKVAKGSIASLVLQRIGKFKPCYVLSDSSDDDQPKKTGSSAVPENAPSKTRPTPEKRLETRVDGGNNNAFLRYEQSLSEEEDSSVDSFHEPIISRVTFRPTVVPQRRLLEQHNEQLAQEALEASADHQTNGHGRATSATRDPGTAPLNPPLDAIDVDETSSATSTSNSTKQTDRDIPTVAELKKRFLASVERTFK